MRKVYATVDATVLVPVRVKVETIIAANDRTDIHKAVRKWAKGQLRGEADVEINDMTVVNVNGCDDRDDWVCGIQEALEGDTQVTIHNVEITDSK
jgi:hypothetical protein